MCKMSCVVICLGLVIHFALSAPEIKNYEFRKNNHGQNNDVGFPGIYIEMKQSSTLSCAAQCTKQNCMCYKYEEFNSSCRLSDSFISEKPVFCGPEKNFRNCDPNWTLFEGHCYQYSNLGVADWIEAEKICQNFGGYLIEIETEEENAWIAETFLLNNSQNKAWIGGSDSAEENVFVWSRSNQPFTYTSWPHNQPDGATSQNCVTLYGHGDWDDDNCLNKMHPYVCEMDNE